LCSYCTWLGVLVVVGEHMLCAYCTWLGERVGVGEYIIAVL
jgi:hypothetical protein